MRFIFPFLAAILFTLTLTVSSTQPVDACGCLSTVRPTADATEFAVNQQAEQIIFEVEEAHIVAHVLIRYAGQPENFAWLVPVPSVPELSISPEAVFGLLDRQTSPTTAIATNNLCPQSQFYCEYLPAPENCEKPGGDVLGDNDASGLWDAGTGQNDPPVQILNEQVVGDYQTIVFSAGDAAAAVDWLNDNDFITNETMAPFMQPYADAGMLFLASKLVPGADADAIKPLRMRFEAEAPMIPLQLTAVAAEPNMTITAYIYGEDYYQPKGLPLVDIDSSRLSADSRGRNNYPMLLSKTIDEAGGRAFVAEYRGGAVAPDFDQGTGCCNSSWDVCNLGFDGVCSCPLSGFDQDCVGDESGLVEGAALLNELAQKHSRLTRLTTRMSPTEMTVDPMFEAIPSAAPFGRLNLEGSVNTLASCTTDILDEEMYAMALAEQDCATMYCGEQSECVITEVGAACDCQDGHVARVFTDLDGKDSLSCIPEVALVDLAAGGLELPDVCNGVDCGFGDCVEVAGFPTCDCTAGMAAAIVGGAPSCVYAQTRTGTAGALDASEALRGIEVCAPTPPDCGPHGWLQRRGEVSRPGTFCQSSLPDPSALQPPSSGPSCEDVGLITPSSHQSGCAGCTTKGGGGGLGAGILGLLLAFMALLRIKKPLKGPRPGHRV